MNFTFFGCLVRGLPLPLGFLNGALFRLGPASEIQTRSKHSKRFRRGEINEGGGKGSQELCALWPTERHHRNIIVIIVLTEQLQKVRG